MPIELCFLFPFRRRGPRGTLLLAGLALGAVLSLGGTEVSVYDDPEVRRLIKEAGELEAVRVKQAGELEAVRANAALIPVLERLQKAVVKASPRGEQDELALETLERLANTQEFAGETQEAAATTLRLLRSLHRLPKWRAVANQVGATFQRWPAMFGVDFGHAFAAAPAELDEIAGIAFSKHGREVGTAMYRFVLDRKFDRIPLLALYPHELRPAYLETMGGFPNLVALGDPELFLEVSMGFKDLLLDLELMDHRMQVGSDSSRSVEQWLRQREAMRDRLRRLPPDRATHPDDALQAAQDELRYAKPWHIGQGVRLSLPEVRRMLPANAIWIDYLLLPPTKGEPDGQYAAVAISSGGTVGPINLGKAARIDDEVRRYRESVAALLEGRAESSAGAVDAAGRQLYESVLGPLLGGAVVAGGPLLLSPDGALNLVPFPMLPDTSGAFLVEGRTVAMVDSLRAMASTAVAESRPPSRPDLLVGNPAFAAGLGAESTPVSARWLPARSLPRSDSPLSAIFADLPGALREVEDIAVLVGGLPGRAALPLLGVEATEPTVRRELSRAQRAHFATHGYTLATPAGRAVNENPMNLSGLALAGAEATMRSWQDGTILSSPDDGILLASEIAALELSGLDRVVLSACDTGLGQVVPNNGVIGLRRAFALAGVPELVLTLWPVLDEVPGPLMRAFYQHPLHQIDGAAAWSDCLRGEIRRMREAGSNADGIALALGTFAYVSNRPRAEWLTAPDGVLRQALQPLRGKSLRQVLEDPRIGQRFTPEFLDRVRATTGGHLGFVTLMVPDEFIMESVVESGDEAYVVVSQGSWGTSTFVLVRNEGRWLIDDTF